MMRDTEAEELAMPGCLLLRFSESGLCEELREYWHIEMGSRIFPSEEWGNEENSVIEHVPHSRQGGLSIPVGDPMSRPTNYNQNVIETFRANGGKVSGPNQLLLLTTIGAKSHQPRTTPVAYSTDGDRLVIVASKAGAPTNPDWYFNLLANPLVTVELGTEQFQARASVVAGAERDRLYAQHAALMPGFADYQQKTSRQIPVIVLERV
jgi:deazaflavin-dependent oxidoreductase (nitroreductase family)